MCGILAYFNKAGITKIKLRESLSALNAIQHRGPDGDGVVLINSVSGVFKNLQTDDLPAEINPDLTLDEYVDLSFDLLLAHRRLSIFDTSSKGFQPMYHPHTGNWVLFNGAIYNYIEIREILKGLGHFFVSATDTEVVLAAYQQWGENCLSMFNGMWSIVLWDNVKKSLFVSNDRYGVKPLYYVAKKDELIFCSEQKQFFSFSNVLKSYNEDNLKIFIEEGYSDFDETTFYKNISRFKPSHYLSVSLRDLNEFNLTAKQYYKLPETIKKYKANDAIDEFQALLADAVKLRMRSDVPYGFSISGGLDSSAILYIASELIPKNDLKTFAAIFPGMDGDESEYVKLVDKNLGISTKFINPFNDFTIEDFEKHIYQLDAPVQSTSFYAAWSVARLVKDNNIKVLLVGQGSDEVFAGYHHHFYRYCRELISGGAILNYLSLVSAYSKLKSIPVQKIHIIILNEFKLIAKFKLGLSKIDNKLSQNWQTASTLIQLLKYDLTSHMLPFMLRADDRSSMKFGIETRHPFMDYRLIDFGLSLPSDLKIKDGWQKWIIRESMIELPHSIRYRTDKKGYTTPQNLWVEKHIVDFEGYLNQLDELNFEYKTTDIFRLYSIGAWIKVNQLK